MRRTATVCCLLASVAVATPAYAQNTTTRVSVRSGGAQAAQFSASPAVTGDGRYVAFHSDAALVAADTNGLPDIYLHDRQTGTTERVSTGAMGVQGNNGSYAASISADGRFVAFISQATNLVSNDTNGKEDIFVHDRQMGTIRRVSMSTWGLQLPGGNQTNDHSQSVAMSADGRYVAVQSFATNFVPDDTNNRGDIFRIDLQTLAAIRVSMSTAGAQANGTSWGPMAISADGRIVAFLSEASNLVPGDTNGVTDVFVRNIQTGTTTRVSVGPNGVEGNNHAFQPSISADGRFVAFTSEATNLDAGGQGVFVHDRQAGVTSALAIVPGPLKGPQEGPADVVISGDAHYVCFAQPNTLTGVTEMFVLDRQTRTRAKVSVSTNGDVANDGSSSCAINDDGTVVAFQSHATNLVPGDTNLVSDIFVRAMPDNAKNTATMTLDKTALTFGAVSNGAAFVSQTASQPVRLAQDGPGPVTWSAAPSQPWLQVSPASGSGSATLSISVIPSSGLPAAGPVTGTIFISLTNAANTLPPIAVTLTLLPNGTTVAPFGVVDTPTDNRTGVTGATPFTGWALDDIEVTRVSICRAAFGAEIAPNDPNCGGAAEIFVGFAIFIDGARPDVAGAFSTHPLSTRAGWGFMVLTNMLPNQGNGTYTFRMRAFDREGHVFVLGTRTMTCANATATLPFGTIDTPAQGETISGSSFVNFGWALTPLSKTIPANGSTIHVVVDGVDLGTADYNHARADIQTLFPGLNNTNGASGFRILDTTALANGLHTIQWTVTDNQGATEGLGSRYFTVSNGASAVTAASASARAAVDLDLDNLPLDTSAIAGRRSWDLEAAYAVFAARPTGAFVIASDEVGRIELLLGDAEQTGYLRTPSGLAPLPAGSSLDPLQGTFTWAPGAGFIGRYDLVFVRSVNGRAVSRREVRIILQPKGRPIPF